MSPLPFLSSSDLSVDREPLPFECQVDVRFDHGIVHVRVAGDVDYVVTPSLRRSLVERLSGDMHALVVDLSDVTLLSLSAMETLLIVDEMAHEFGVAMHVVADSRAVVRPLLLAGLHRRLRIHPSLDEVMSLA